MREQPSKRSDDLNDPEYELTDEQVRRRAWTAAALYLLVGAAVATAFLIDCVT